MLFRSGEELKDINVLGIVNVLDPVTVTVNKSFTLGTDVTLEIVIFLPVNNPCGAVVVIVAGEEYEIDPIVFGVVCIVASKLFCAITLLCLSQEPALPAPVTCTGIVNVLVPVTVTA